MPCLQRAGMKQVRVRVVFRPLQPREQLGLTSLPCPCRLNGGVCVRFPAPPPSLSSQSQEACRPPLRLGQGQASSVGSWRDLLM